MCLISPWCSRPEKEQLAVTRALPHSGCSHGALVTQALGRLERTGAVGGAAAPDAEEQGGASGPSVGPQEGLGAVSAPWG